ncbi:MAG TPA: 4Fe-4S dicluster-binding protein [Armatimonadota bacterium]|jgi:pyruvate ferredoxin oxidoreductase delta subunit
MSHYAPDAKYQDLEPGGIIPQAGNAVEYQTGGWRLQRPHRRDEDCIDCMFCFIYCPDVACPVVEGSVKGQQFDYEHCKGCGICAQVCPKKCIDMSPEGQTE